MHRYAMHVLINMCAVIIALDLGNFLDRLRYFSIGHSRF